MRGRKRERQILHNYMEVLACNYRNIEPGEMTSSICEIYDRLHGRIHNSGRLMSLMLANFIISVSILVVNFRRRKSG